MIIYNKQVFKIMIDPIKTFITTTTATSITKTTITKKFSSIYV